MSLLELPFLRNALAAGLLAGTALSLIGTFVLVRRVAFSGLAASQLAALGAVLCTIAGLHWGGFGVALAFVAFGVWAMLRLARGRRVPEEAWTACLYVVGAAASVLVLAKAPMGESHSMTVFFGNLLSLEPGDLAGAASVFAATAVLLGARFDTWVWLCFDPLSARVAGLKVDRWNVLFFLLFAFTMTMSIDLFGVLLSFSYLLLPATVGLSLARSMRGLFAAVIATAVASTALGTWLSFAWDLPTGPLISCLMGGAALAAGSLRR